MQAMAFFGRFGNLLRHAAANRQIMHSSPSFFQAIRCKSSSTPTSMLYVGNIPYNTVHIELMELFSRYGRVFGAKIEVDSLGFPKGFAFVHFHTIEEAIRAHKALNGQVFNGRRLKIGYSEHLAQRPTDRPKVRLDAILCGRLERCHDYDACDCRANMMRLYKSQCGLPGLYKSQCGLPGSGRGHRTGGKNGDGAGNDYSSPNGSFGTSSAGGGSYSGSGNFGSAGGVGCHDT